MCWISKFLQFSLADWNMLVFITIGVRTSSRTISKGQAAYHGWRRRNVSTFQIAIRYYVISYCFPWFFNWLFASFNKQTSCAFLLVPGLSRRLPFDLNLSENSTQEVALQRSKHPLSCLSQLLNFWRVRDNQSKTACVHVCSASSSVCRF